MEEEKKESFNLRKIKEDESKWKSRRTREERTKGVEEERKLVGKQEV
jgi:hypothetical protein